MADLGFSWGGANFHSGCANLFFLAENSMKKKEFGPPGGSRVPGTPLDPPMYFVDFPQIFELVVEGPMQAFQVVVQAEAIETRILVIRR